MAGAPGDDTREAKVLTSPRRGGHRIIIDALAARFGGTAYAAVQTAWRLALEPDVEEVAVAAGAHSLVAAGLHDRGVVLRTVASGDRNLLRRLRWEAVRLPRWAAAREATGVLTWSGMLPRRVGVPVVCYLANPVMLARRGLDDRVRRGAARMTAARAAAVLVPSDGMRELVEPVLGRQVDVVPLGVDSERFSPGGRPGDEILSVADFYAHKRHDIVLAAWARLPSPRPILRLVGNPQVDRRTFARIVTDVERLRSLGEIRLHHALSLSELVNAYRAARVLVIASEVESFCMPLLEAQACSVPVVIRDLPALRTAAGSAATMVRGDDPRDWADAVGRLVADDADHAAAASAGRAHARELTWERTVSGLRCAFARA